MKKHQWIVLLIACVAIKSYAADEVLTLETIQTCDYSLAWSDRGSGGDDDVAIYTPQIPASFYMIGGYAQGDYHRVSQCVTAVRPSPSNAEHDVPLLAKPAKWRAVWLDKGTGANMDGSIWQAIPPHEDYVCIGNVGQTGYNPPRINTYRCVHKCLVTGIGVPEFLWTDRGTGARNPVSIYRLGNSKSFHTRPDRKRPARLLDLKSNPVCNADLEPASSEPVTPPEPAQSQINPEGMQQQPLPKNREWVNPDEVQKLPPGERPKKWVNPDEL